MGENDPGEADRTQLLGGDEDCAPAAGGETLSPGTMVGVYRIRRPLGQGGMGQVYLADQLEPIRRQVALKLLSGKHFSGDQLAWFEIERQVLAQMRHPAIAQIYDAGTTTEGVPWFAMEYIEGEPIVAYCRARRLGLRQRIELLVRVCQGVQHAHQKGVVHRDLKPGNILVGEVDGQHLPRIIDFGIATATRRALSTGSAESRDRAGTPEYMSPEQAGLVALDVDTRSDVYSLGVVLHELLTGRRPAAGNNTGDPVPGAATTAVPPSQEFETLDGAGREALAAEQGLSPAALAGLLRRELDWVVRKAMRFDRAERYASVAELTEELRRFLDHEPLQAVPASRAYVLRKRLRRHRLAYAAGGSALVALLVGLGLSLWGLMEARVQRSLAEARSAELAEVVGFQQRMLQELDVEGMGATLEQSLLARHARALALGVPPAPEQDLQQEAFARSLRLAGAGDAARELIDVRVLQPALAGIEAEFGDQPLVAAGLIGSVARVQSTLGHYATAVELRRRELAIREPLQGARQRDVILARYELGIALTAQTLLTEAEAELQRASRDVLSAHGEDDELVLSIQQQLAMAISDAGRLDEARDMQEALAHRATAALGPDHARVLAIRNNLGITLIRAGAYPEARDLYEDLVPRRERLLGTEHGDTLGSMSNLSILRGRSGDHEGALALQQRVHAALAARLGSEHPNTLNQVNNMVASLHQLGRLDEARAKSEELLALRRKVLGPTHAQTLRAMHNLASLLNRMDESEASLAMMREVRELRAATLGPEHPDTLSTRFNIVSVLSTLERYDEASNECRQVLALRRRILGEAHPETLDVQEECGALALRSNRPEAAEAPLRAAFEAQRARLGDDAHPRLLQVAARLVLALRRSGKGAEAEAIQREFLATLMASDPAALGPVERQLRERIVAWFDEG